MSFHVRLMQRGDIAQVTKIDRESFPSMWPPPNYRQELGNRLAHYIVACNTNIAAGEIAAEALPETGFSGLVSRIRRLFNHSRSSGHEVPESNREYVVGFAGFWVMADEAHLISIAVYEKYRCQGIGELLLLSVIDMATQMNIGVITLEVRASNVVAQSLYSKYGFTQVGTRSGYYTDNREEAVLMTAENITSASFCGRLEQLKQAHYRKWGIARCDIVR
jgi:ribosomal-protein-alanine N-acetyltransferase